jgi:polysaccharide export outer membrane protein
VINRYSQKIFGTVLNLSILLLILQGCASDSQQVAQSANRTNDASPAYIIGAGDTLNIFVWGNTELGGEVPVRPDGRITTPLVEDVIASGKTPTQLAREMEIKLSRFIKKPVVTITVLEFVGRYSEQVRVVGQVVNPQSIPYREHITLLDVVIAVGGLTEFAAGNRATISRTIGNNQQTIKVKLEDLLEDGDTSANMRMYPGDVLFVPEAWF